MILEFMVTMSLAASDGMPQNRLVPGTDKWKARNHELFEYRQAVQRVQLGNTEDCPNDDSSCDRDRIARFLYADLHARTELAHWVVHTKLAKAEGAESTVREMYEAMLKDCSNQLSTIYGQTRALVARFGHPNTTVCGDPRATPEQHVEFWSGPAAERGIAVQGSVVWNVARTDVAGDSLRDVANGVGAKVKVKFSSHPAMPPECTTPSPIGSIAAVGDQIVMVDSRARCIYRLERDGEKLVTATASALPDEVLNSRMEIGANSEWIYLAPINGEALYRIPTSSNDPIPALVTPLPKNAGTNLAVADNGDVWISDPSNASFLKLSTDLSGSTSPLQRCQPPQTLRLPWRKGFAGMAVVEDQLVVVSTATERTTEAPASSDWYVSHIDSWSCSQVALPEGSP